MGLLEYHNCCLVLGGNQLYCETFGKSISPEKDAFVLDSEVAESMVQTLVLLVSYFKGGRVKTVFFSPNLATESLR